MQPIDWSVELKKIDREFSGLPPETSPDFVRAKRAAEHRLQERKRHQIAEFGVWMRLSVVMVLVGALNFWPYARVCGLGLAGYLAAVALIVAGGIWIGTLTFTHRMPRAHAMAFVVVLWGLALMAAEVLPRAGYIRAAIAVPQRWSCTGG